ncbi:hypothetical protein ACFUN7_26320 [Streptomyces sp. NPDC057236]|uniref:hypothetical protein n=1 Tax=Streptomyces sp. NPDC057236 TaxID=3346059 RepID=UPI003627B290
MRVDAQGALGGCEGVTARVQDAGGDGAGASGAAAGVRPFWVGPPVCGVNATAVSAQVAVTVWVSGDG